jgi:N-acetyl-anhydromuramyl-L-alanine amidase AmpD
MPEPFTEANGWCPFADYVTSPWYWGRPQQQVLAVVLHIAEGTYQGSIRELTDPNSQRRVSAHFIISKQGDITQMVSILDRAHGNGLGYENGRWYNANHKVVYPTWPDIVRGVNPNHYTISIEHEGFRDEVWTPEMDASNTRLLRWIADQLHMVYEAGHTLIGHCNIDPVDKWFCPGPHVDYARIAADANGAVQPLPPISVDSPILGPASGLMRQAVAYIQARLKASSEYKSDVGTIMGFYWQYAVQVGVDPFLAAAQCIHETDSLNSFWAARPRRNPAGLGVHEEGGLSFPTWDLAVQAHLGQLLAMALTDAQANPAQTVMMSHNPRHHLIPSAWRGVAHKWRDLGGRWTQNPNYADGVVRRALEMRGT